MYNNREKKNRKSSAAVHKGPTPQTQPLIRIGIKKQHFITHLIFLRNESLK